MGREFLDGWSEDGEGERWGKRRTEGCWSPPSRTHRCISLVEGVLAMIARAREELEVEMGAMNTGETRMFCLLSSTGMGEGVGNGDDFEKREGSLEAQL